MSPRKRKGGESPRDLAVTNRHAAGIDVHAALHMVSVPAEFRKLAGLVPAASRQRGQDLQTPDASWRQSRGAGAADGGARLPSCQERARRLLSAHSSPRRRPQGDRGNGAQDRRACLPDAQVRPGVRTAKPGGVRRSVSASTREVLGREGGAPGLQAGAGNAAVTESVACPAQGAAPPP